VSRRYGILAEFKGADALLDAARKAREAGYERVEAYSPFPVEGLAEVIGFRKNRIPAIVFIGGLLGGIGGYFMQWYSAVVSYPINSGGKPPHSWPEFIPVTFELTILCAALAGFFGLLLLNGLPRLHHPLFDVPEFDLASRNRFFLCIREDARNFLENLKPIGIWEVPG
jgi:hypothetical protein